MLGTIITLITLFGLIFLGLHLLTNLSNKNKLKVLYSFIFIIVSASIYESLQDSKGDKNREVILKFMQGNSLICKNSEVNKTNFNFVSGTLTFIGKIESNKNLLIKVEDCK